MVGKLLIIEDVEADIFILKQLLNELDIHDNIDESRTAADTIEKLTSQHYDLIIMDFNLPDANALEIIEKVKKENGSADLPIITLTGSGNEQIAVDLMKIGVIDYINKETLNLPNLKNAIEYTLSRFEEIAERNKYLSDVKHYGLYDVLTNLPNRSLFFGRFEQIFNLAQRNKSRFSLFFIDLNEFKKINDEHGHKIGDVILETIGKRLGKIGRESDTVARYGGDEFVLILPEVKTIEEVEIVAKKYADKISEPIIVDDVSFSVSAAIGVAIYPDSSNEMSKLINIADASMYEAKKRHALFYIL